MGYEIFCIISLPIGNAGFFLILVSDEQTTKYKCYISVTAKAEA
jgi:hypothetical protein